MSCCASCSCAGVPGFAGASSAMSAVGDSSDLTSPVETLFVTGAVEERGVGATARTGMDSGSSSIGVSGGVSLASFDRRASRFFSSVRRKTLMVVRNDL